MADGLFAKIRRHAAVSSGNFAAIFRGAEIPALPATAARLVAEVNQSDPNMDLIVNLITSSPETSVKVIRTVNSSLFSPRTPIISIRHAVSLLGLRHIRPIVLALALVDNLPRPKGQLFNHQSFWSDSLIRAMLARSFAVRANLPGAEETFTAMLIADIALPVLLNGWGEYYAPILERWQTEMPRLSAIEAEEFGWDHAQAGAWILQSWGFPEELVCFVGLHNASIQEVHEVGLEKSALLPVVVASLAPSGLRPKPIRAGALRQAAQAAFGLTESDIAPLCEELRAGYNEICELFGLPHGGADQVLATIADDNAQEAA